MKFLGILCLKITNGGVFVMGKKRSKDQTKKRSRKQKEQEKFQETFNNPETEFASEFSLAEENRKIELKRDTQKKEKR
jgi:hypothetical protein